MMIPLVDAAVRSLSPTLGLIEWAIGAIVVMIGVAFYMSIKKASAAKPIAVLDRVSNHNRARIAPIKRIYDEISEVVGRNPDSASIKVIGTETLQEASSIIDQAVKMLAQRDTILKSGALQADVETGMQEKAQQAMDKIDAGLKEAEAALELLKNRLQMVALGSDGPSDYDQEFRESIMRLRSLSISLDEAQELEKDTGA